MNMRFKLLAGAAAASLLAGAGVTAPPKHRAATSETNQALLDEVRSLRAELNDLRAKVDSQGATQASTAAQVQSTQAQVQQVQTQVQVVTATPPVTKEQVNTQIAAAVDKEHHNDKFYFKGITITPGGFLEAAGIYRNRFQGDDIASSFNVPFPAQSHASHASEGRFSARQSRISLLAQGKPDANTLLSAYGELDFQGSAQTSNSNQSNSYVPRIRNMYGTIDWTRGGSGIHILAGQNWSLLTLQGKGMGPRSEVTPPQIDAQYVPGFAWARQPGVRITADFMDHKLWLGLAAENAQTTFGGTGVPVGITSAISGNGTTSNNQTNPTGSFQQFYNGFGSSLTLNTVPDFIGKVAVEDTLAGHTVHIEGFGIYRTFSTHLDGTETNSDVHSWGYGASINANVIPKLLDAQFTAFGGHGIGRYGSAGLPDVTSDNAGNLHPLKEYMLLAGVTLHATKALDLYGFAGREQEYRRINADGTGLGLPTANNSACFIETNTNTTTSTCAGNTRRIQQLTVGFWDKFYQGSFGRAQVGIQYSYTQRQLFDGVGGMPQTHNDMGFVSFRYYPF